MNIDYTTYPNYINLPVLTLRDTVIFPSVVVPLFIGREKSINALENALNNQNLVFLVAQKDGSIDNPELEDIYEVGVVASITQPLIKLPDNAVKVVVQGVRRGKVIEYMNSNSLLEARIEISDDYNKCDEVAVELEALKRSAINAFNDWNKLNKKKPARCSY